MRTDSFTTSWLAARLGADPARIDARRRAGELFAVPGRDGLDWLYPAWQFDADGEPLPAVERLLAAAREANIGPADLDAFLNRRAGVGGRRMWELVRDGNVEFVVASLRSAA
ncbi:MAG TPA: hypothetical protein VH281_02080 [Gaiellaceae bacterium]|jgi:hypothetical protein